MLNDTVLISNTIIEFYGDMPLVDSVYHMVVSDITHLVVCASLNRGICIPDYWVNRDLDLMPSKMQVQVMSQNGP